MDIKLPDLLAGLVTWFDGALHPVSTLNRFLFSDDSRAGSLPLSNTFLAYLSASILLSLIVEIPIMQIDGIRWTNGGFQILSIILEFSSLFLQALAIHIILSLNGIASKFWKTFILFCSPTLAYMPLTNILGLKTLDASYAGFQAAKKLHLDLGGTVQYFITNHMTLPASQMTNDLVAHLLQTTSATLSVFTIALTSEGVAQYYNIDRTKAYPIVVTASILVIAFHTVTISALSFMTTYAFLTVP